MAQGGGNDAQRIAALAQKNAAHAQYRKNIAQEVTALAHRDAAEREERRKLLAPPPEVVRAERRREREMKKKARAKAAARSETVASGGLRFGPGSGEVEADGADHSGGATTGGTPVPLKDKKKAKREPMKNDPRLVAAARELRDRWLEHAAARPGLIGPSDEAKYAVSKRLERDAAGRVVAVTDKPVWLLNAG